MLGPVKLRCLDQPIALSIEQLVPADHFYWHLDRTLDLSFMRDLVREHYALTGRPPIDPIVFFKLQLIMFFEGIRSERQLMQIAADRLSLRWYLGYGFDEDYRERVREYHGTGEYHKAMRIRQVWVEPLFGEAKEWHGLRWFRLRGLDRVNMEGLWIAAGQNLKRLLSWKGWGRRPFPAGSLAVFLRCDSVFTYC